MRLTSLEEEVHTVTIRKITENAKGKLCLMEFYTDGEILILTARLLPRNKNRTPEQVQLQNRPPFSAANVLPSICILSIHSLISIFFISKSYLSATSRPAL